MFSANNYGYNPYGRYMPQQPIMQQSPVISGQNNMISANSPVLSGKMVESEDIVKTIEIPLDGSISYFPLVDGSAIITKQLQRDGTSKLMVYKPLVEEQKEEKIYVTYEDMNKQIKELKKEIKALKKLGDDSDES